MNGVEFTGHPGTFTYHQRAHVSSVDPSQGPIYGSTNVTIKGSNFVYSSRSLCKFDDETVSSMYLSSSEIRCISPPHPQGVANVWLSFNGLDFTEEYAVFEYLPTPAIISVVPSQAWASGGEILEVTVNDAQVIHPSVYCMFEEVAVKGVLHKDSNSVTCLTPSVDAPGSIGLTLKWQGLSDQATALASKFPFRFRNPMAVTSVMPYFGSEHGGTTVRAVGENFPSESGLTCVFGSERTLAVWLSTKEVLCSTVAQPPGLVDFTVELDGVPALISSVSFEYTKPLVIDAVVPNHASIEGGTSVTVTGVHFRDHSSLVCRFGSILSNATYINETSASCLTPAMELFQDVPFSFSLNGIDFSTDPVFFTFHSTMQITLLNPNVGSVQGGTVVDVIGEGFRNSSSLTCHFGEVGSVTAIFVSEAQVQCTAPAKAFLNPGVVYLELTDQTEQEHSANMVAFEYLSDPVVLRIAPLRGLVGGGTRVVVSGLHFAASASASLSVMCQFGETVAEALYVDSQTVECLTPVQENFVGYLAPVSLSLNGKDFSSTGLLFDFLPHPAVESIYPVSGPTLGGTVVKILGHRFSPRMYCRFNSDSITEAIYVSAEEIHCITPAVPNPATQSIELSVNKVDFISVEAVFEFYSPLHISSLYPDFGSEEGGLTLDLMVSDLSAADQYELGCRFETNYDDLAGFSAATIGQDQILYCETLARIALQENEGWTTKTRVLASGNFVDVGDYSAEFEYWPEPSVLYIHPDKAPGAYEAEVIVYGKNFTNTAALACRFGSVVQDAEWISPGELRCKSPRHVPETVLLEVTNNGRDFSNSGVMFTFQIAPSVLSIQPTRGPYLAYTAITVTGARFYYSDLLSCRIGDVTSPVVEYHSSNEVVCIAPPSQRGPGIVSVEISNNNASFTENHVTYQYDSKVEIMVLNPSVGASKGGVEVLISGRNFVNTTALACKFDDLVSMATFISTSQLLCIAPPHTPGNFPVEVTLNGVDYSGSDVHFSYSALPVVNSVWPVLGPAARGGTVLTVHGSGFLQSVELACAIGLYRRPATWLSPNELLCETAPYQGSGLVSVEVTNNGAEYSQDGKQFYFALEVALVELYPKRVQLTGQVPIFIVGSNYLNTTALACKFDSTSVRATFLSPELLVCQAPSHSAGVHRPYGHVNVEVSNNGLDWTDSELTLEYYADCDKGYYCPGLVPQPCPNGTYCPDPGMVNFSLCQPGTFQPYSRQVSCLPCPVGYYCPDHGLVAPMICPAGYVCDVLGLRTPVTPCPRGHYCLQGTKAYSVNAFNYSTEWIQDNETATVTFNVSSHNWAYHNRTLPETGWAVIEHVPASAFCKQGSRCTFGVIDLLAEQPFACPLGHYCRTGVATPVSVPRNYSTPQRCYEGYHCPRGSSTPEGSGPCPTGYYCPSQTLAIICPVRHYCPGVGNTKPLECYPGTFNPNEGQSNCTVCPTGHICPGWGRLLPEQCPRGFVCMALGLSAPVLLCPQGYWCDLGTLTLNPAAPTPYRPFPCPSGTFCLGGAAHNVTIDWIPTATDGITAPQTCTEGTYCEEASYSPLGSGLCFAGHYCPPGVDYPIETPIGTTNQITGAINPILCFPGTYSPLLSSEECWVCPAGFSCQGYGTYVPSICDVGTYRSLADSVTCRLCPTGTFNPDLGASDISQCFPCPPGRVCGLRGMSSMSTSQDCPAGYTCGAGTDRNSQFNHKCPAGYYCGTESTADMVLSNICSAGYYCQRGTPDYLALQNKCNLGYFCPQGSSSGSASIYKCPQRTASASGANEVVQCYISEVDVCDKKDIDPNDETQMMSYYPTFSYTLLDGTESVEYFDSLVEKDDTGEIAVVLKVMPVNVTASVDMWANDTVEVFRTCPTYGAYDAQEEITIIGRNFKDSSLLTCRFRSCTGSDLGPRKCLDADGTHDNYYGAITVETQATFINSTRVTCPVPPYEFTFNETDSEYCIRLVDGGPVGYKMACAVAEIASQTCPNTGGIKDHSVLFEAVLECNEDMVEGGECEDRPIEGYMFNPCYAGDVFVEVSNNGQKFSGDGLEVPHIVPADGAADVSGLENHVDYSVPGTFAVYTYVESKWVNGEKQSSEYAMQPEDFATCNTSVYWEEGDRSREDGWYTLKALETAKISVNLEHIPTDLVYDEHYKLAIYVTPSRCDDENCNSKRVRQTPEEVMPCRQPLDLPEWFTDTSVPKNQIFNFTMLALEDVLFKVEIHIMYGLFLPLAPFFKNTTIIDVVGPSRANMTLGTTQKTRQLSPFVSFEERDVPQEYIFLVIYEYRYTTTTSAPLNMPPRYDEYAQGRVLLGFNVSELNSDTPLILEDFEELSITSEYFANPTTSGALAKEEQDSYMEVFHEMTYNEQESMYEYIFERMTLPYLPYFSNCYGFDSYLPVSELFENTECALTSYVTNTSAERMNYPAFPHQDDIKSVGPYDFGQTPIADWCELSFKCNYEEDLANPEIALRWFEQSTGTTLFYFIDRPLSYANFTGRVSNRASAYDAGSGAIIDEIVSLYTTDAKIAVTVDRSAANLYEYGSCTKLCFPRSVALVVAYYQKDTRIKQLVWAKLVYSDFDTDSTVTDYQFSLTYYPLNYFDLIRYFVYDWEIFLLLFITIGAITVFVSALLYVIVYITTRLENPPKLRIHSMFALLAPPPLVGVILGLLPNATIIVLFYLLINVNDFVGVDDDTAVENSLDEYALHYMDAVYDPDLVIEARVGRTGLCFVILSMLCLFVGAHIFLPKRVSKREKEIQKKRDERANKESVWIPTVWKRSNLIFTSYMTGFYCLLIIEFSFWSLYGTYYWYFFFLFWIFNQFAGTVIDNQLKESLLSAPIGTAMGIAEGIVTLSADDFLDFLLGHFVDYAIMLIDLVYFGPASGDFLDFVFELIASLKERISKRLPKRIVKILGWMPEEEEQNEGTPKRNLEGIVEEGAETVEPILDCFGGYSTGTMALFYTPFLIFLIYIFSEETQMPSLYGIKVKDLLYYLMFAGVIIPFQLCADIFILGTLELYHGWKIYDYLVYTRYRFLQRETRWKGLEETLDECIDETMRTLDQMCFSSQYYMMLTIHTTGIVFFVLGVEMMFRSQYNMFGDVCVLILIPYVTVTSYVVVKVMIWIALKMNLWKLKGENTAWASALDEEEDIPGWDDIRGASHDAYIMNQRITSETFRYKFLNYNRAWLINQLPSILTPRTLRRSRPYLINQFTRILNQLNKDISSDSEGDTPQKFGPVALNAASRNLIRWWLSQARKRLKCREVVAPLIAKARGNHCEQCLSRKQLQVELVIPLEVMIENFERENPGSGKTEFDQVGWKRYWMKYQRYETICLPCITKNRDDDRREAMRRGRGGRGGGLTDSEGEEEDRPDFGPVYLSAASRAILLGWYRAAQDKVWKGKKGRRRRKKVIEVSDDEGEEVVADWARKPVVLSDASRALAIRWLRSARARLQHRQARSDMGRARPGGRQKAGKKGRSKTRRK